MIINRQRTVRVARRPLELFLRRVCTLLGLGKTDLTICLVSDAEMAQMNEAFRRKKGPTDVLSFPADETRSQIRTKTMRKPGAGRKVVTHTNRPAKLEYLGDVAIAPTIARRNAKEYGRDLPCELKILILHGVLHLLGYDHETDKGQMERLERRLRQRFELE